MNQIDFLHTSKEDYLYEELQKTKNTVDRLRKSMHVHLGEMQELILSLKEAVENKKSTNTF